MPTSPANDPDTGDLDGAPDGQGEVDEADPISEIQEELEQTRDKYHRALADLDNYRKRSSRDLEQRVAAAKDSLLTSWLEAVDSVDRALALEPGDPGLRAVLNQMELILTREGVVRLEPLDAPFDPQSHEVVAVQPGPDAADGTVLEVARAGYAYADGRVLRPAQVVVARQAGSE